MNTNRLTLVLAVVALVVALAGFGLQWRINQEMQSALVTLGAQRADSEPMGAGSRGSAPNNPAEMRDGARIGPAELAVMRDDIEKLKTRTQALGRMAMRSVEGAMPLDLRPASAWKNLGRQTAAAAMETFFWASEGGDVETLAASILLEPDAREKALAILARMPEATRALYDTPEKFIALFMARDGDIRAMQVLDENVAGQDALVNVRAQKGDGKTKEDGYVFRRVGDGWQLVVPGKAVDKYGKKLTEPDKKKG